MKVEIITSGWTKEEILQLHTLVEVADQRISEKDKQEFALMMSAIRPNRNELAN